MKSSTYWPRRFVVACLTSPVNVFVRVNSPPNTTAFAWSVTVPVIVPVVLCAWPVGLSTSESTRITRELHLIFLNMAFPLTIECCFLQRSQIRFMRAPRGFDRDCLGGTMNLG